MSIHLLLISDDAETVDDTLIVNATYSWSHAAATRIQKHYRGFRTRRILAVSKAAATRIQKHYRGFRTRRILAVSKAAATRIQKHYRGFRTRRILAVSKAAAIRIQKHYRGFRTRRNLADSIIAAELLWQTTLSHTPNTGKVADVNIESEKHIVSLLKWAETRVEKHWISELPKGWKTWKGALQRWLEVIDPRHRVGRNLSFYFQKWMTVGSGQPFFYWLDVGDGKTEEHPECSRDKLRHERNTYLELASKSEAVESLMSLMLRSESNIEREINNNQRGHDRADGFDQQASNSEAVKSPVSSMPRSERDTEDDINNNQREHDHADGFDRQASNSGVVMSPAPLMPSKGQNHETVVEITDDFKNNQPTHNGPADGFNLKDLLRSIFYAMNLLFEIATAVLDYLSSQQRQPRYALSGMILSITVMAISLIQLAYTVGKEGVSSQWKGWIPWLFGNPVQVVELLLSVSQCVFAIIAYHYLSRDQNNPTQFSVYPIAFAFCLLCLSFRRREP
uniref:Calmodulin-binding family protein n=1 Tax=Populus alba TaxID=43335 RepID=A0A4U5Q9V0_POPAL|nr:hypothetical protein D5086_0000114600 [Populus alba]